MSRIEKLIAGWREAAKKDYPASIFGDGNTGEPSASDVYEECAAALEAELNRFDEFVIERGPVDATPTT